MRFGQFVVVVFSLVVCPSQFGPFCKVVLRGGVGHFAVEAEDFATEAGDFGGGGGLGDGEARVEVP